MTDPKLIIDDDWKSQVQKEKEEARKKSSNPAPASASQSAQELPPPPPASWATLISTLASQSLAAMGQFGDADIRLDYAKHFIDTLEVLQEKTRRNLTGEEHDMLNQALHQLRLMYVAVQKQLATPEESPKVQ